MDQRLGLYPPVGSNSEPPWPTTHLGTEAYNGNWADDMRHGQGQMGFGDGAQYSGGWLNDARHGHGSYRREKREERECLVTTTLGTPFSL